MRYTYASRYLEKELAFIKQNQKNYWIYEELSGENYIVKRTFLKIV